VVDVESEDGWERGAVILGPSEGEGAGELRDKSDCLFRKTATEYDREYGIKWFSCTEK
jgi:hypothetical protein